MSNQLTWKPIPGWEGIYEASSGGQIRSLARSVTVKQKGCVHSRSKKGRVLKPITYPNGYYYVHLTDGASRRKVCTVHSLVALTFIGLRPDNKVVCHNDGTKTNNEASNLRYDWHKNNSADMRKHGTLAFGDAHRGSKLSEREAHAIRRLWEFGVGAGIIARSFECTTQNVHLIVKGKSRTQNSIGEQIFQTAS